MVLTTLSEWNSWWKTGIVDKELLGKFREINSQLKNYLNFREIKILIGVRRSGKSTLFYQFINYLLNKKVNPKQILLINFEDDVLSKRKLREIFDVYQSNINPDTKPYIFLDEVHRCPEWALFLRKLYDLKQVKHIFITDSSSKFIKSEYAKSITGRNITLTVYPISFREYISWKDIKFDLKFSDRKEINKIRKELSNYIRWGAFPEIFFKEILINKKTLLNEYLEDIVHKDIVERYNVNYSKIKQLVDFLVSNSTNIFSLRKYSRQYKLSLETINTYLGYLEEVFLFFFVPKFDYSVRKQQLSQKKIYICDTGLLNNVGFQFSENLGKCYENIVFLELKRRGKEIYYWKDKNEVDFLIKKGLKPRELIQVCLDITDKETKEREINGLLEAMKKFKLRKGLIITDDYEAEEKYKNKKIKFIPLWKWLLTSI